MGVYALIAAMTLTIFAASTSLAHAQGSAGASVAPPITDITASAGESLTKYLEVTNNGNASTSFSFSVANLTAAGEEGEANFSGAETGDLASWITLSPESVTLGAGESVNLTVSIEIPSNASAGGHYATVFAKSAAGDVSDGSGSGISTMVGANFLLKVTGTILENAQITSFAIADASFDLGESAAFELRVANLGNSHIAPTGYVELFRNGTKVDQIAVNDSGANVLPNSTRRFVVESDALYLPGSYTAEVNLTYGSGKVLTTTSDLAFVVRGEYSVLVVVSIVLAVLVGALALSLLVKRKKVKV